MEKSSVLEALKHLGLSPIDAEIYLYVSANPDCMGGNVIRTLGLNRSKVYDSLKKLCAMGLLSYASVNNVNRYSSTGFRRLSEMHSQMHKNLDRAIAYMETLTSTTPSQTKVRILEGLEGYRVVKEDFYSKLSNDDEVLILGAPPIVYEKLDPYISRFHKKRIREKVKLRIIYSTDAKKFRGGARESWAHTSIRYLPKNVSPSWMELFGEHVMLPIFTDRVRTVAISDPSISASFRHYFEIMWKNAKKP